MPLHAKRNESKAQPSPPEPTMRQERTVQATIFEVFARHEIGGELKAISQWLDRQSTLASLETEAIVAPDKTDPKAEVLRRYATVRKIAPAFLEAFTFKATPSAKPIIDALDVLRTLYRTGQRALPAKAPIRFIRRVWRSLVIQGGEIDRKAYELCVFFELRDRLRAGD